MVDPLLFGTRWKCLSSSLADLLEISLWQKRKAMSASNSVSAGSQLWLWRKDPLSYSCVFKPAVETLPVGKACLLPLLQRSLWWETFRSSSCELCVLSTGLPFISLSMPSFMQTQHGAHMTCVHPIFPSHSELPPLQGLPQNCRFSFLFRHSWYRL